jgi:HK97 family phage portal protein
MFGLERDGGAVALPAAPRAMSSVTEISVTSPAELDEALRRGVVSASGQSVNERTALKVAAAFACLRIRTGAIANTPVGIKRRLDDRTRADATDHPAWLLFNRRPNRWQTPAQFKRMMEAHLLLRGQAYAVITRGAKAAALALTPLHPDRVEKVQLPDNSLVFIWTRKDGSKQVFPQDDMFHLVGLSLDGFNGLSVLAYAREAIGLSLAMEQHGSTVFAQGANVSGAFQLPEGKQLSPEQADYLRAQLDEYRQGGSRDGKVIVLEDGLKYQQMALTAEDAQWLEGREFSRTDICMFFGVQPHLIGITAGNTQLGSSIETVGQGFVTYSLEDSFVTWEEAIGLQVLDWVTNPELYARFNRNAMVRGDIKTRWEAYVKALQWGVMSPNDVLAAEDENPRAGGDIYYDPPNTAGRSGGDNVDP